LFALIDEGTCFAGTLAELVFCADRAYMLALPDAPEKAPRITLSELNMGYFPMVNHQSRLQRRFLRRRLHHWRPCGLPSVKTWTPIKRLGLGLVTAAPDDIDWADELRIAIEERAAMSPDSLTGLEANLRFCPKKSRWKHVFLAACRLGKTGSSTARTRWATKVP
jgi:benzoyl-CoA-dihydrodiol lyase